ncbi:MAG TPA: hypothetical protein VMA86_10410 [Acetobacteraceae bacterium]|nr:hypothetical protein [Acetobacteraceae bacterium]
MRVLVLMATILMAALATMAAPAAFARPPPGFDPHSPFHYWWEAQHNRNGGWCCAEADGHLSDQDSIRPGNGVIMVHIPPGAYELPDATWAFNQETHKLLPHVVFDAETQNYYLLFAGGWFPTSGLSEISSGNDCPLADEVPADVLPKLVALFPQYPVNCPNPYDVPVIWFALHPENDGTISVTVYCVILGWMG